MSRAARADQFLRSQMACLHGNCCVCSLHRNSGTVNAIIAVIRLKWVVAEASGKRLSLNRGVSQPHSC